MKCPKCDTNMKVIDSRYRTGDSVTFRRRECTKCEHRESTNEVFVFKKNDEKIGNKTMSLKLIEVSNLLSVSDDVVFKNQVTINSLTKELTKIKNELAVSKRQLGVLRSKNGLSFEYTAPRRRCSV